MEREIQLVKKLAGKGTSASEVKALEGKLNIMEKKLKDYTNKTVKREIANIPIIDPEPEVTTVTETVPMSDGTVKRTTKKTTKKTTTKKK